DAPRHSPQEEGVQFPVADVAAHARGGLVARLAVRPHRGAAYGRPPDAAGVSGRARETRFLGETGFLKPAVSGDQQGFHVSLTTRTIALAEGRQLEELAHMLEQDGATIVRCPMVSILDAPDAEPVVAWLRELTARRFGYVVLLTGEGLRRLLGFAERAGLRDSVVAALAATRTITRGPKPARALKGIGLPPTGTAPTPTTEGVIAALSSEPLQGQTVGVQLYSPSNPPLVDFLTQASAIVRTVLPYIYAPAIDSDK